VLLVMVAPGSDRLTVQAAEADTGPHHTAQNVAAGRKMAQGAEDGIDEISIHGAGLPGQKWQGWAGGRESRQAGRMS
jgi:hypothetical protein